jgi:hypothetical protein
VPRNPSALGGFAVTGGSRALAREFFYETLFNRCRRRVSARRANQLGADHANADNAADGGRARGTADADHAAIDNGHEPDDASADDHTAAIDGGANLNGRAANGVPHQQGAGRSVCVLVGYEPRW